MRQLERDPRAAQPTGATADTVEAAERCSLVRETGVLQLPSFSVPGELTAQMEPFDSFWEGPADIDSGYTSFFEFYRRNYLSYLPSERSAEIVVVSCGPGYFVDMLARHGYTRAIGIDSDAAKIAHAQARELPCHQERAFPYLAARSGQLDAIVCEQELNHLTKPEMLVFLQLCRSALRPGGRLIAHGLNGANPITGSEALAQNFDHYSSFTEYSLRQVLEHAGFAEAHVFPLHLYVFYRNPANWIAWGAASLLSLLFRLVFVLYGKENRIFTKKIAAVCTRPD